MSIPQPTLDDRSYAGLLEEARTLIPSLAPQWTNHNPSDPGITLVELFAWLTEMLIYRVNRLPEANTRAYLQLLNGPEWQPGDDLEEDIRATVLDLRRRHRAVTAADYEALARAADPGVARARCVPKRKLDEPTEAGRRVPREGCVSVVVVPDISRSGAFESNSQEGAPMPSASLLNKVRADLEPRRLTTVRQFVVPPVYVPIHGEILIATRPEVAVVPLRSRVKKAIEDWLDALKGGPEGEGWPFGRDVYTSEIYRLLEKVPGVDYVSDVALSSTSEGAKLWHESGDQIGVELAAHHLPWAQIDPSRILIGTAFLQVCVHVKAKADLNVDPAAARRAAKNAVRLKFQRPAGAPGEKAVTAAQIEAAVGLLTEIADTPAPVVTIQADPARLSGSGAGATVQFVAGELADLTVTVEI
jgi:hypothetical protein